LLFEMASGESPFYEDEHFAIFKRILAGTKGERFSYPSQISDDGKDAISCFLVSGPNQRLTSLRGSGREVREHPFFKPIDFVTLARRELPAPWLPTIKHPGDLSNIQAFEPDDEGVVFEPIDRDTTSLFECFTPVDAE